MDRTQQQRVRRMAQRQGLTLSISRRRDPLALDYGITYLRRPDGTTAGQYPNLDAAEAALRGDDTAEDEVDRRVYSYA